MCKIISFAMPMADHAGRLYAGGPNTVQSQCETHQWSFPSGRTPTSDKCPIGQIEAATAKAIAEIEAAKVK